MKTRTGDMIVEHVIIRYSPKLEVTNVKTISTTSTRSVPLHLKGVPLEEKTATTGAEAA